MTAAECPTSDRFADIRRCPLAVTLIAIALPPLLVWLFTHAASAQRETIGIVRATDGLILQTLQLALAIVAIVACWLAIVGRMRLRDLGFRYRDIAPAIVYSLVAWMVVCIASLVLTRSGAQIDPIWIERPRFAVGRMLAQLAGNALCEELIWRGFLVPQVYFLLGGSAWGRSSRARLFAAAAIAATLFAFYHIPMDASKGTSIAQHAVLFAVRFLSGLMLTAVWLQSGNLLIAVACHSFVNEPAPLFACDRTDVLSAIVALGTLACFWALFAYGPRRYARNT